MGTKKRTSAEATARQKQDKLDAAVLPELRSLIRGVNALTAELKNPDYLEKKLEELPLA